MMRKLRGKQRHEKVSLRHFKICTIGIIGGEKDWGSKKMKKILTGRKIMI